MKRLFATICLLVATTAVPSAQAQELVPPHVATRLGLIEAWARTVATPNGEQSIADQQLFVHEKDPHEYVEVVTAIEPAAVSAPAANAKPAKPATSESANEPSPAKQDSAAEKVLVRIPIGQLDARGNAIGKAEAERLASNEIRRLKRRGVVATMRTTRVPRVRLYTLSNDGTLEARDAESGQPIWMARVGDRELPFGAIGVSENELMITNGSNLLQVDVETGEVMEELRTIGTPQFGAVNSGDYVMMVTIGGGVECYSLADPHRDPFRVIVAGRPLALPTKAPGSSRVAWATNRQFVYVMEMQGTPSSLFRLKTDGIVSGRIATASGNRFFFGSEAGQVYAVRATRSGVVLWSVPFGEPFYSEPLVIEDQLFMLSTYGSLYGLSTKDGSALWDEPVANVQHLIGGLGDLVYVRTLSGSLAVIDRKTGRRAGDFSDVRPLRLLPNHLTNRLYFVSEAGAVQCLRLEGSELPTFVTQPDTEPQEPSKDKKETKEKTSGPFDDGGKDPFGAGADPFGGGADPFGGGAMDDPFGN